MNKLILSLKLLFVLNILSTQFLCAQQKQWYKGNLHTHSFWSDGDHFPEYILDWYKTQGYDFISLSEHNILAEGEKWMNIRKRRNGRKALREYQAAFGNGWIEMKIQDQDTLVRLKQRDEYISLFEEPKKFLVINSEEVTDRYKDKPIHINATNVQELIQPKGGRSISEVMQNNIDAILEQRERTGHPIIPHINHPNFGWAMQAEEMIKLNGERFFEVYNGHPAVNNYGDDQRSSTESMWDEINVAYLNMGKPIMYGLAVDDAHNYHNFGLDFSNTGRGWVMVYANMLEPASLISALENGDFYSSSGVSLRRIKFKKGVYSIRIKGERGVKYTISFIGSTANDTGKILSTIRGTKGNYKVRGDELFIRAKITSNKLKENPYKTGEVETAWTQPVVLSP